MHHITTRHDTMRSLPVYLPYSNPVPILSFIYFFIQHRIKRNKKSPPIISSRKSRNTDQVVVARGFSVTTYISLHSLSSLFRPCECVISTLIYSRSVVQIIISSHQYHITITVHNTQDISLNSHSTPTQLPLMWNHKTTKTSTYLPSLLSPGININTPSNHIPQGPEMNPHQIFLLLQIKH